MIYFNTILAHAYHQNVTIGMIYAFLMMLQRWCKSDNVRAVLPYWQVAHNISIHTIAHIEHTKPNYSIDAYPHPQMTIYKHSYAYACTHDAISKHINCVRDAQHYAFLRTQNCLAQEYGLSHQPHHLILLKTVAAQ